MKNDRTSTASETAQYIGGMARELRALAADANLGFIVYLLSMVEQEATALSPEDPSGGGAYKRAEGGR